MKKYFLCSILIFAAGCNSKSPVSLDSDSAKPIRKNAISTDEVRVFGEEAIHGLRFTSLTFFLWHENAPTEEVAEAMRQARVFDEVEELAMEYGLTMEQIENTEDKTEKARLQENIGRIIENFGDEESMFKAFEGLTENIAKIQSVSDWVDTDGSASVYFGFQDFVQKDGAFKKELTVEISGVKLGEEKVSDFKYELGNVSLVEFNEEGANLEFVVRPSQTEEYVMNIHRVNYQDRAGRIIFKGDIIYRQYSANGELLLERRGQAKLADRSN